MILWSVHFHLALIWQVLEGSIRVHRVKLRMSFWSMRIRRIALERAAVLEAGLAVDILGGGERW